MPDQSSNLHIRLLHAIVPYRRILGDLVALGINFYETDLFVNVLEMIADDLGVPEDNTCDFRYEDLKNNPNVYCRDWLLEHMDKVDEGKKTVEEFYQEMVAHGVNLGSAK